MADDPNIIPRSAILQSITTEAGGFYTTITTVASTFLGASLLFLEKFTAARSGASVLILAVAWISLVASIGFVARVRYLNLRSGRLALRDDDAGANAIDIKTDRYSNWSQLLLISGMIALVIVGLLNFDHIAKKDEDQKMSNHNDHTTDLKESIPYGSLRPSPAPIQQTPTQAPVNHPPQANQPKK